MAFFHPLRLVSPRLGEELAFLATYPAFNTLQVSMRLARRFGDWGGLEESIFTKYLLYHLST